MIYRRLSDTRTVLLNRTSDVGFALQAALEGYDVRKHFDASGMGVHVEVGEPARGWMALAGVRREMHRRVAVNAERDLFGTAENFPPLGEIQPGGHTALEG